jgi:hypothetical protein
MIFGHLTVAQLINVWARWADHDTILIVFDPRGADFISVVFIGSDRLYTFFAYLATA